MDSPRHPFSERYVIGETLGRGGMGVVFAAFDKKRGHAVALKRLSVDKFEREADLARAITQFEREYHTLSQLAHPHVIEVYDYGLDVAGPYYTMMRLRGTSMRALAPLPWALACRLTRDIVSALALVHSRRLVHRDITPLNVYCTTEEGAKLIDFGAMIPAGVAQQIVGTPSFIAPECLNHAALDGQTDLYSLGATLYFALTGENAYPAHSINSLRESWSSAPPPPSQFQPDIPAALDELVLGLLALEVHARPRSAAEVYERLTAVAELPRDERSEIGLAYLSKAVLVGRSAELATIRRCVELAPAAHGGALLVLADGGMGRSRLLDAVVLEAKLRGLSIARADAADGPSVPGAVARRLLVGMLDEMPELRAAVDELGVADLLGSGASAFLEQIGRDRVLGSLNQLLLRACAERAWALVIDDVHAIDEVSIAFIGSLALQTRSQRLLLVTGIDADAAAHATGAAALLVETSRKLRLEPLDASQCRSLLSSLFGEVPNLDLLATLSESVCEGKPRSILEAAERLLELGLVRYRDGSFWINGDREALAGAVESAGNLSQELAVLSPAARALLDVLALDEDAIMTFADYPFLLGASDQASMHAALSELIARSWLQASHDRAQFRRGDRRRAVALSLDSGRRQLLHARLAERCSQLPISRIYAAHHFICAGATLPAIEALDTFWRDNEQRLDAETLRQPVSFATFEAATRLPLVDGAHPALHATHAIGAAMNLLLQGRPESVAPRLASVLRDLAPFSGIADYAELSELEPAERVKQALTRAHARCAVPGKGGLPDVFRALRRQAQISIGGAVTAYMMNDPSLLEIVPDLRPFSAIAPPLALVARVVGAIARLTRGRLWESLEAFGGVLADLRGPLASQIDSLTTLALTRTTLGYLGRLQAELGSENSLALIEADSALRPESAESSRSIYFLAQGDLAKADAARRRGEVLAARASSSADTRIVELLSHISLYALCDDVLGLRRTQLALQQVTTVRPHWQVRAELARVHALRCQGAIERGLRAIERLMRGQPHDTADWYLCAAAHLELLNAARRHAEAAELGARYAAIALTAGVPRYGIQLALARSQAELGLAELAEQQLAAATAELQAHKAGGVVLAQVHEVGARVALLAGDRAVFAERLQAWETFIQHAKHPQLVARYNSLLRDAAGAGEAVNVSGALTLAHDALARELAALRELARGSIDDATFYQRFLDVVLEQSGAAGGVLYAWAPEGPTRLAQAGESVAEGELDLSVSRYGSLETGRPDMSTGITQSTADERAGTIPLTSAGRAAALFRLDHLQDGVRVLQGVLVLDLGPTPEALRIGLAGFGAIMRERARNTNALADTLAQGS